MPVPSPLRPRLALSADRFLAASISLHSYGHLLPHVRPVRHAPVAVRTPADCAACCFTNSFLLICEQAYVANMHHAVGSKGSLGSGNQYDRLAAPCMDLNVLRTISVANPAGWLIKMTAGSFTMHDSGNALHLTAGKSSLICARGTSAG